MGGCACATLMPSTLFLGTPQRPRRLRRRTSSISPGSCISPTSRSGWRKAAAASYADFRLCRYATEYLEAKEHRLEQSSTGLSAGFAVRLLLDGTLGLRQQRARDRGRGAGGGFVALSTSPGPSPAACNCAKFVLEDVPVYQDRWDMPMKADPVPRARRREDREAACDQRSRAQGRRQLRHGRLRFRPRGEIFRLQQRQPHRAKPRPHHARDGGHGDRPGNGPLRHARRFRRAARQRLRLHPRLRFRRRGGEGRGTGARKIEGEARRPR